MHAARSFLSLLLVSVVGACATAHGSTAASNVGVSAPSGVSAIASSNADSARELGCADCTAIPMPAEITRAAETRIATLKARGGDCSRYATVLETSYRSGRITLRPFMWRVGTSLTSGEARPNGDMTLAREIDSLNVGVRTVDDVLWSMEHEAVHITFDLASGIDASEAKADQIVRACKS
jgi:hypothetical protein